MNRQYDRKCVLIGIGGFRCSCCRPFGSKKLSRIHTNRKVRRIAKMEVRRELCNV